MDLNKSFVINTNITEKLYSPSSGVVRIPLQREEAESGRTTSIVTYMPGASFTEHKHPCLL